MLNPFCWFGRCRICWGTVVEEVVEWSAPQLGPQLYGEVPGNMKISYWYCTRCGAMYKFKPGSRSHQHQHSQHQHSQHQHQHQHGHGS